MSTQFNSILRQLQSSALKWDQKIALLESVLTSSTPPLSTFQASLLSWISSTMYKACTLKHWSEHQIHPACSVRYWNALLQLLKWTADALPEHSVLTATTSTAIHHLALLTFITSFCQQHQKQQQQQTSNTTRPMDDTEALLLAAEACLELLTTHPVLKTMFTPTVDAVANCTAEVLQTFRGFDTFASQKLKVRTLLVLKELTASHPNRKKVFSCVVTKLLSPLLEVLAHYPKSPKGNSGEDAFGMVRDILSQSVFDDDHWVELATVVGALRSSNSNTSSVKTQNYTGAVFEKLKEMKKLDTGLEASGLKVSLPVFYDIALDALSAFRKTSQQSASILDPLPFNFFLEMVDLCKPSVNSSSSLVELEAACQCLTALLETVLQHRVYKAARGNQLSPEQKYQKEHLENVASLVYNFSTSLQGGDQGKLQSFLFPLWKKFAILDIEFLEPYIDNIYVQLLNPHPQAKEQACQLWITFLEMAHQSRSLGSFLNRLFKALETRMKSVVATSGVKFPVVPIFQPGFLLGFSQMVKTLAPVVAIELMDTFKLQLGKWVLQSFEQEGEELKQLCRKKVKKSHSSSAPSFTLSELHLSSRLCIPPLCTLMYYLLRHIQWPYSTSSETLAELESQYQSLHSDILLPFQEKILQGTSLAQDSSVQILLEAFGMLYHGMVASSPSYWTLLQQSDDKVYSTLLVQLNSAACPSSDIIHDKLVIQHSYYCLKDLVLPSFHLGEQDTSMIDESNSVRIFKSCAKVHATFLQRVIQNLAKAIQDNPTFACNKEYLSGADAVDVETLPIAQLRLLSDGWSVIMNGLMDDHCTKELLHVFMDVLVKANLQDPQLLVQSNQNQCTVLGLVLGLLRSPRFFESKSIRKNFLAIYLSSLEQFLMTSINESTPPPWLPLAQAALSHPNTPLEVTSFSLQQAISVEDFHPQCLPTLFRYFQILSIFPLQGRQKYFSRYAMERISFLVWLFDRACFESWWGRWKEGKKEVDDGLAVVMEWSMICRKFQALLVTESHIYKLAEDGYYLSWYYTSTFQMASCLSDLSSNSLLLSNLAHQVEAVNEIMYGLYASEKLLQQGIHLSTGIVLQQMKQHSEALFGVSDPGFWPLDPLTSITATRWCFIIEYFENLFQYVIRYLDKNRTKKTWLENVEQMVYLTIDQMKWMLPLFETCQTRLQNHDEMDSSQRVCFVQLCAIAYLQAKVCSLFPAWNDQYKHALEGKMIVTCNVVEFLIENVPKLFPPRGDDDSGKQLSHVQVGQVMEPLNACAKLVELVQSLWVSGMEKEPKSLAHLAKMLWFVMESYPFTSGQLGDNDSSESLDLLKKHILSLCRTMSNEEYESLLNSYMEIIQNESSALTVEQQIALIHLLDILLQSGGGEKGRDYYRKTCSVRAVASLTHWVSTTTSPQLVQALFQLMVNLSSIKVVSYASYELGVFIHALLVFSSEEVYFHLKPAMTQSIAEDMFQAIAKMCTFWVTFCKSELMLILPSYLNLVKSHSWYDIRSFSWLLLDRDARPPCLTINSFAPLSTQCAENFSRLLSTIGQRSNLASGINKDRDKEGNHSSSESLKLYKALCKHVPFFITEFLIIQSSNVATIPNFNISGHEGKQQASSLKGILISGLYVLLDCLEQDDWDYILANVDALQKSLLQQLYTDYNKYYKYTGKV